VAVSPSQRAVPAARRTGARPAPRQPKLPAALTPARWPEDLLQDEGVYLSLEYENVDLADRSVISAEIDQCRFRTVNFGRGEMERTRITDSVFQGCDFANFRVSASSLVRAVLGGSRMTGMSWADGSWQEVTVEGCRMDMSSFRFSRFKNVLFSDCKLIQSDFQAADLRGARFERCDLTGAQFSKAQMEGTRLSDCALDGIGGVTSLRGATVTSRDALGLAYTLASALGILIED
jgi:uncharacterized protein YjbI with pentapeptide repeats